MTGLVIVRGAGDLATGTIVRLANCGLHVAVTECARPSAIRRRAALSEAVYDGAAEVEGVVCRRMDSEADLTDAWQAGQVPLFVDEAGDSIRALRRRWSWTPSWPSATWAPAAIWRPSPWPSAQALPPGATWTRSSRPCAGTTWAASSTGRGPAQHRRARQYRRLYGGARHPRTGGRRAHLCAGRRRTGGRHRQRSGEGPGHRPCGRDAGLCHAYGRAARPHPAGLPVTEGLKIADIDPRLAQRDNCGTISDKARCIAGGVLEAVLHLAREREVSLF